MQREARYRRDLVVSSVGIGWLINHGCQTIACEDIAAATAWNNQVEACKLPV
ncbi:hypothetical protein DL89DRAFT_265659 [Linderina pennispora]|uniref:Uncharacterized protein n=1 Tax=Linderina pennispora TaxID=61395 RepID=A0A1Y1WEK7_9FUNG|nr:uncharacterized protein DL89DRAFT_265659 [Linderina pennispora]ORX71959.1 hypothetical protein DL89DRAFT_265659 [Linderina pennispora]